MPIYCIHGHDRPGATGLRDEHYAAHRAYLAASEALGVRILASGPLVSEDGASMIGSLLLVEAKDLLTVTRFNAGDPFRKAGLWSSVAIDRFSLRVGTIGSASST